MAITSSATRSAATCLAFRRRHLLELLRVRAVLSISEWARYAGVSRPTATRDFEFLVAQGVTLAPFRLGTKVMGFSLAAEAE